jgi:hypothetical protein
MLCMRNECRVKYLMAWTILSCGLMGIVGCGSRNPQTYPVALRVSFADGTIPAGAVVAFHSDADAKAGRRYDATGTVEPDGSCRLSTFKQGDGAVAGHHRVTVASPPFMPGMTGPQGSRPVVIAPRYAGESTSGLEFAVTSDPAKNQFTIQVARPSR